MTGTRYEARRLRTALRQKLYQARRKRKRIFCIVRGEYQQFKQSIEHWPVSKGMQNSKILTEYLRANLLLLVQLEQWMDRASSCSEEDIPKAPSAISSDNVWDEYLFELEDRMEEAIRTHDSLYRSMLLDLLQVLDAFERLKSLPILNTFPQIDADQSDGQSMRLAGERTYKCLFSALRRRGVKPIPLSPGDYPPVEATRIISRLDDSTSDTFMIDRIVEQGYTYKNQIFRKTAVIVKTSPQEQ